MKRSIPLIVAGCLTLFFAASCKKLVEQKKQDALMDAITNGVWIVEQYMEGPNNISSQFLNYEFKFNSDGSVTGTQNGIVTSGTWSGSMTDYTITSSFPTAGDPLKKLNGLWKIKDSDWDYVKAEMTVENSTNVLSLRKKP